MEMNKDYRITESTFGYKSEDDLFGVEILTGEFAGIQYTYGTLNFAEVENSDGTYPITFDYKLREGTVAEDMTDEFESVIGSVLNSVLLNSLETAQEKYDNETRNADPKASD